MHWYFISRSRVERQLSFLLLFFYFIFSFQIFTKSNISSNKQNTAPTYSAHHNCIYFYFIFATLFILGKYILNAQKYSTFNNSFGELYLVFKLWSLGITQESSTCKKMHKCKCTTVVDKTNLGKGDDNHFFTRGSVTCQQLNPRCGESLGEWFMH